MSLRAFGALTLFLGGCTIHVVEQPASPVLASPGPTVVVANAPEARPRPVRHPRPAEAPPTASDSESRPQPAGVTAPPRSELTPSPRAPTATKPHSDQPLYTPFRRVGSAAASTPLSNVAPAPKHDLHKVKKTGT